MWRDGRYVYAGPALRTTNHETLPQLIEAGDSEVLEALIRAGHFLESEPSAAVLAVWFDRPEILKFCDDLEAVDAGGCTPAFYAAWNGKVRCLEALARLGVDLKAPCTKFGEAPAKFFRRHPLLLDLMVDAVTLRDRAAVKIASLVRGGPERRIYLAKRVVVCTIQRRWREVRTRRRSCSPTHT